MRREGRFANRLYVVWGKGDWIPAFAGMTVVGWGRDLGYARGCVRW